MPTRVIKALLWKEWRETRWKWLAFYAAFHIPAFLGGLAFTFDRSFRFDILVLSNALVRQYMNIFLIFQSGFAITAGLFLVAFYAASSVAPEMEGRQLYFLIERPVRRRTILLVKFLVGGVQSTLSIGMSIVTTLLLAYTTLTTLASGVTLPGSWDHFSIVFQNGLRGTLWAAILGIMVFSGTFIFSILFEKWWVGVIAGAISLIGMFYFMGRSIFDWILANVVNQPGGPEKANLDLYARLEPQPMLIMLAMTVIFYLVSQFLFQRKELH